MRLVLLCAASAALCSAASRGEVRPASLTIIIDFEGPHSENSIAGMKREVGTILKDSGLSFDWRLRAAAGHDSFPDLVLLKLNGNCGMEPKPSRSDVPGPLAWTHTVGSKVLRFSEVQCDKLRTLVHSAAWTQGGEPEDELFGRALGRVVAHELCHILGNTFAHSHTGVAQPALSGRQLVSRSLELDPSEIERLQFWRFETVGQ